MSDRWRGVLLFLPVPLVLFLFTRAPLGVGRSLLLGVAIMGTHRLYARPFALARAERRCLWCGRAAAEGPLLTIEEPDDTTLWRTCGPAHEERARRFLGWVGTHSLRLQIGILLALVVFLVAAGLVALHFPWPVTYADTVAGFRLGIASTVLPLGLLLLQGPVPGDPLRAPFPVHIQALIGTAWVIWLFRIVGTAWLLLGLRYFLETYLPALLGALSRAG